MIVTRIARRCCGHDPNLNAAERRRLADHDRNTAALHATITRLTADRTELAELAQARTDRLRGMVEELRAARAERHEALVELQATRAALAEARSDGWVRPGGYAEGYAAGYAAGYADADSGYDEQPGLVPADDLPRLMLDPGVGACSTLAECVSNTSVAWQARTGLLHRGDDQDQSREEAGDE